MNTPWTQPWMSLWKQSLDIATGSPQVVHKRVGMMSKQPWSTDAWWEAHRMIVEKMTASAEYWQILLTKSMPTGTINPWALWSGTSLCPPTHSHRTVAHAMHHGAKALDAALKPVSKRVRGNVKRLGNKRT